MRRQDLAQGPHLPLGSQRACQTSSECSSNILGSFFIRLGSRRSFRSGLRHGHMPAEKTFFFLKGQEMYNKRYIEERRRSHLSHNNVTGMVFNRDGIQLL